MIPNLARLIALLFTVTTLSAASLRQLWSVNLPVAAPVSLFTPSVTYGPDGSFGISWLGRPAAWVSSTGTLLFFTNVVNATISIDFVSNKELLLRLSQYQQSKSVTVLYLTNSAGVVNETNLGVMAGTGDYSVANPPPQKQSNVAPIPILFQFVVNGDTTTITCYTVDGTGFSALNPTNGAPNSLSSPMLGKNGLTVNASTTNAAAFTIQLSTNLSDWQNVITIEAPKPSQTVTVPLNERANLFLRLLGQ